MVGLQSLDLPIGVRVPVSQPNFRLSVVGGQLSVFFFTDNRQLTTDNFFMSDWHETEIRVRYAETDKMGIVHHSNYLVWFEIGRSEFCRSRGFSYLEMEEEEDALMVVAESYCRYKSPAFYEDALTVRTQIADVRSRSLRFLYEIYRASDDKVLAEGETLHVVTNAEKKVRSLPGHYKEKLLIEIVRLESEFPENQAPS